MHAALKMNVLVYNACLVVLPHYIELDFVDSNDTEREIAGAKVEFILLLQKLAEGKCQSDSEAVKVGNIYTYNCCCT